MPEDGDHRIARFKATCARTGIPIRPGNEVVYSAAVGWQRADSVRDLEPIPDDVIYFQNESKERFVLHVHGDIVRRIGTPPTISDPRILFVLGSHTAGDPESGYVYTTVCRLATEDEAAPFLLREREENRRKGIET